jgi:hypothetical protein
VIERQPGQGDVSNGSLLLCIGAELVLSLSKEHKLKVRIQILTATNIKMVVFWDAASCSQVITGHNTQENRHLHILRPSREQKAEENFEHRGKK